MRQARSDRLGQHAQDETFALAPTLNKDTADRIADALPHVWGVALGVLAARAIARRAGCGCCTSSASWPSRAPTCATTIWMRPRWPVGLNLSTRYVYELFAGEDIPLMKWVWSKRLENCRADLATAALQARSVGEIAYHWGFNNVAHFSRAFRQAFGQSPREFRKLHMARAAH